MTTFSEVTARLAARSYDPSDEGIGIPGYRLVKESNQSSGYRGLIYREDVSGNYVVVHTGTEFDSDKIRDGLLADAQMALLKVNQQLDDARDLVELAMETARRDGTSVTVADHGSADFLPRSPAMNTGCAGKPSVRTASLECEALWQAKLKSTDL